MECSEKNRMKHKPTAREKLAAQEQKERMYCKARGRCYHCGKPVSLAGCHLAHRVPAHLKYIKKYGRAVIYHEDNMDITCPDCNYLSLLDPASCPVEAAELVEQIEIKLGRRRD